MVALSSHPITPPPLYRPSTASWKPISSILHSWGWTNNSVDLFLLIPEYLVHNKRLWTCVCPCPCFRVYCVSWEWLSMENDGAPAIFHRTHDLPFTISDICPGSLCLHMVYVCVYVYVRCVKACNLIVNFSFSAPPHETKILWLFAVKWLNTWCAWCWRLYNFRIFPAIGGVISVPTLFMIQ